MEKWQQLASAINNADPLPSYHKMKTYRFITETLIAFLVQYGGLLLSTLNEPISLIWFASGTACAFVFMRGYRILWGIGLGSFFAYYFAGEAPLFLALLSASILIAQAALLCWGSFRFITTSLIFYRPTVFLKFVIWSGFLTASSSGLLSFASIDFINTSLSPQQLFLTWWLANWCGVLIIGCALVTLNTYFSDLHLFLRNFNKSTDSLFKGWCGGVTLILAVAFTLQIALLFFTFLSKNIFILQILLFFMTLGGFFIAIRRPEVHYQTNHVNEN